MSYKIWMVHSLATWHFLSTMQTRLKSMNSFSRLESTPMLTHDGDGMPAGVDGRKQEGTRDLPYPSDLTPPKEQCCSGRNLTRIMLPNIPSNLTFRGKSSESWPLHVSDPSVPPHVEENETRHWVQFPPFLLLLLVFSFCPSSACWCSPGHCCCYSHFLPFTDIHSLGTHVHPDIYVLQGIMGFLYWFLRQSLACTVCLLNNKWGKHTANWK